MPKRPYESRSPSAVPIEYSGKWIAWNRERTEILASANTMKEILEIAKQRGFVEPIFSKIPRADIVLIG